VTLDPRCGPPPLAPLPPRHREPHHVVHLILTLLTAGLWLGAWVVAALIAAAENAQERKRYEREAAAYYAAWQHPPT
jgi:hypothetical protein